MNYCLFYLIISGVAKNSINIVRDFEMNKIIRFIMSVLVLLVMVQSVFSQSPKRTVNVGYFEGGDYFLHKTIMGELRKHLENM
ncbi:MAG: hypothetical protein DRP51_01910, partial [Candidatus Zixiibacteriota bacterium]